MCLLAGYTSFNFFISFRCFFQTSDLTFLFRCTRETCSIIANTWSPFNSLSSPFNPWKITVGWRDNHAVCFCVCVCVCVFMCPPFHVFDNWPIFPERDVSVMSLDVTHTSCMLISCSKLWQHGGHTNLRGGNNRGAFYCRVVNWCRLSWTMQRFRHDALSNVKYRTTRQLSEYVFFWFLVSLLRLMNRCS